MAAFFEEYLIPGAKAFVSRRWPTAAEAIALIREAGGTPVLAHPFWDLDDPNAVAALIDDLDIDGVEVFYPAHDRAQTKFLVELCAARGLAATASSDFHGPNHKMFDRFGSYPTYDLGTPELPPQRD
jgi:predicted metal-dependent phosphoesterase TrpH